jgi:hypothetical protein
MYVLILLNKGDVGATLRSYSGGPILKPRPGDQLVSRFRGYHVLHATEEVVRVPHFDHDCFPTLPFQFIIRLPSYQ